MQGNNDDGEPPVVAEDCLGHAQENGALSFFIAKSDQSLIKANSTFISAADIYFKNPGFSGNLLSADTIIESGWYSDQWWKWDCGSMMGVPNVGCSAPYWLPQFNYNFAGQAYFANPTNPANRRPYLRSGDPDEPDMPQAHPGMCPAPFSEDYQGPGTNASVTARTWYTRAAGRSVVVSGQGNAFVEVQPRYGEGPYSTGTSGIDFFGDGQFTCTSIDQGSPYGNTNVGGPTTNKHSGAQHSTLPYFCQVMTAQMQCEQRGEGDTMETKYTFVIHFGQMLDYDGARTCNNCWKGDGEQTYTPYEGGNEVVPNQCGFPVCGLISSARWCPCTGGAGIPYDGQVRLGVEIGCNSMFDGPCGRFCRCKEIRMMFNDTVYDEYFDCDDKQGRNTYDGCDLSSCGASCFVDCLGTPVGQCNCPPFSPDNYWKSKFFSGPNADPYDPPLHLCSSLCGTTPPPNAGSQGDLCHRNGCTAPEANFPVTNLGLFTIQYPYSNNEWLLGNLSPQEYFSQLSDEQNVGRLYNIETDAGQKYLSRLEIT